MYQPTISSADARKLVARGAQLVDVRNPAEYQRGALPGSVNIPLPLIQQALKRLDRQLLDACGFMIVHNLGSYTCLDDCR